MTIMDSFSLIFLVGFTSVYVVSVLKINDFDQFEPRSLLFRRLIAVPKEDESDGVDYVVWSVFDYIRQIFGAYKRTEMIDSYGNRIYALNYVDFWKCSKCLSFWVSGLVVFVFDVFLYAIPFNVLLFIWAASAGLSYYLTKE